MEWETVLSALAPEHEIGAEAREVNFLWVLVSEMKPQESSL